MREDDKLRKQFKSPFAGVEVKNRSYLLKEYDVLFLYLL